MPDSVLWDYHQNENRNHFIGWYPRSDKVFKFVKKYLKKWKIYEIGFGDGYLLNKLSLAWYCCIWQDISELNIELTKKQWNNERINFVLWDLSWRLKADNNSLDGFIASEVLEHMDDEELNICINDIYRCLKKWWYAFITFPCREILKKEEFICPHCWNVFHIYWHKQSRDDSKIKEKFSKFEIVKIIEFFSRSPWRSKLDKIVGYYYFFLRTLFNSIFDIYWKTYLIVLKK